MNKFLLTALPSLGAIFAAHRLEFHPVAVTIAAVGFLAYALFSQPTSRRPATRLYWGE